jgi:hypothetical protein
MTFFSKKFAWLLHAVLMSVCIVSTSHATPMFIDNFENGLGQWTGLKGVGFSNPYYAKVVNDPLNTGNHVLTFTKLTSGGNIFSPMLNFTPGTTYRASFDYLGLAVIGSVLGNLGGFTGFGNDTGGGTWYYATMKASTATDTLIDDGKWHHYTYDFTAPIVWFGGAKANSARMMFQDYSFSGGVPGDAYFDNIQFSAVSPASPIPEPSSALFLGIGLLFLLAKRGIRSPRKLFEGVKQHGMKQSLSI